MHINLVRPEEDAGLMNKLAECAVATVHEALGQVGAVDRAIRPLAPGMRVCGRALTVRCHPGDNLMLIKAMSMAGEGDVIVLDPGDRGECGPFGEMAAVECQAKGVAGLVTSGSVRDSEAIARRGFSAFCTGTSFRGTGKANLGEINHPVSLGGVVVNPGDYVLGDADGVVVVPHDRIAEVIERACVREAKEAAVMERLALGESLFDVYGYQEKLDALGCSYETSEA